MGEFPNPREAGHLPEVGYPRASLEHTGTLRDFNRREDSSKDRHHSLHGRFCGLTVSQAKRLKMEDLWCRQTPAGQREPGHGKVKQVDFTTHAGSASVD